MPNIQREITKKRETTLHIAAAANQEEFVKNLVERMSSDDITAENTVGSTALAYAAATGNVNIAKAMLKKNRALPNLGSGMKPLFMAALLEHYQMVEHLSRSTKTSEWDIRDQTELFVTYARVGYYGKYKLFLALVVIIIIRFNYTKLTCGLGKNYFTYPWFKKYHLTHLWYVPFVFHKPLLLKSGVNRYFCSNFMSLSSQNKKYHKNVRETRSKSGIGLSLSIHINLEHKEHKSLNPKFFFSYSQALTNFLSNHITIKEIKLFNLSLKHPFGSTFNNINHKTL